MTVLPHNQLPQDFKAGLEGIVAGMTAIADVNPDSDTLIYRGYPAHELAEKASYEEVAFLLLYSHLPNRTELKAFQDELIRERSLPTHVLSILKELPASPHLMVTLQLAVTLIHMVDPDAKNQSEAANLAKAKRLIAKSPTLVATLYRISEGKEPIAPNPNLDHASNFLYMLTGKEPEPEFGKIVSSTMILYAEHGYNASTFSAKVTASTLSDLHSSVVSGIGTLKGPLHGGANEAALEMLLKIGDASKVEDWLRDTLARKEKIMGFGHRVYKKQDSRAPHMKKMAQRLAEKTGDTQLFPLAEALEKAVLRDKKLYPNVDYYAAVAYHLMGLPAVICTPIFAMARMAGWTAHIIEQHLHNRLIRPEAVYTGAKDLHFVPIDDR